MLLTARSIVTRPLLPLVLAVMVTSGCGPEGPKQASDENGGTMVVVQGAEPSTLFPPLTQEIASSTIFGIVYDRLAEIGPELEANNPESFSPRLAKAWNWSSDSLSIEFELDPAAHWHDGEPLKAEDVRFTFQSYTSDTMASPTKDVLGNIDSVTVKDSLTAVFWFKRRLPNQFFDATYHMYVLPSHLFAGLSADEIKQSRYTKAPVGTGRFKFRKWTPGSLIELVADTANSRGRAKLDRIIFTFSADFGAATVKLFSGEADLYEAIRAENLPQVASSDNLRLVEYPTLRYGYLGYNLRAQGDSSRPHPLFGDVNVRRALAMAVDRSSVARNVFDTLGQAALAPAPRALVPDTSALRQIPYDPPGARALLDSLGWTVNPKDGIRERNGVRFSFDILSPRSSQPRQRYSVNLQQQFLAVGVDARPTPLENRSVGEKVMSGRFDSFLHEWAMTPGRYGMPQTWRSNGGQNFGKFKDPNMDEMLDSALTSMNASSRTQRFTKVFQYLIDEQPGLWLYEAKNPVAINKRIHVTPLRGDGWQEGVADWYINPSDRIERDKIGLPDKN